MVGSLGVAKGDSGVPVAGLSIYPGLVMAFDLATQGKTDLKIARALGPIGSRTVGPRSNRSFAATSVRGIITNRFYLGYLPDARGGYVEGQHAAFIDQSVWDQAQELRRRRLTSTHAKFPTGKRVNALTGITYCWRCGSRIHTQFHYKGEPRLGCYNRQQGRTCSQRSGSLSVYEIQIEVYLNAFHIPDDYQEL